MNIILVLWLGAGSLYHRGLKSYPFVPSLSTPTLSGYFSLGLVTSWRVIFSGLESSCWWQKRNREWVMAAVSSLLAGRTWSHWSSLCLPNLAFWFSLSPQHRCFVSRAHGVWLCSCPIPLQAGNFAVAETVALWVEMDLLSLICSCMVVSPFSGLSCLGAEAAGPLCFIFIVQYLPGVQNVFTGWMMRRRDGGSGSFSFKILQMTCLPSLAGNSHSPWKRSLHRIPPVPADHHTPFHLGRAEECEVAMGQRLELISQGLISLL